MLTFSCITLATYLLDHPLIRVSYQLFGLSAALAPTIFFNNNDFAILSSEEKLRLKKVEKMVDEIKDDLGIFSMKTNLYVLKDIDDNACCLRSAFSLTGTVIGIGQPFVNHFASKVATLTSEDLNVIEIIRGLSDNPAVLAKELDALPLKEQKSILALLQNENNYFLATDEIQGVIADELGHAKNAYLLTNFVLSPLLVDAIFALSKLIEEPLSQRNNLPSLSIKFFFFGVKILSVILGIEYISRMYEWQADYECKNNIKYAEGMQKLTKRLLIESLLERDKKKFSTCDSKVSQMLESWDFFSSHPNVAKRKKNAFKMTANPLPKPSQNSSTPKVIIGVSVILFEMRTISDTYGALKYCGSCIWQLGT